MVFAMNESLTPAQVRAARALLAWSQQDLASNAQVAASTVADFERGQRMPVPNNADAIRSALEDAGVKFMAGGAVLTKSLPSPEGLASGSPIRWIEASDLSDWADRRDCQDGLPELLSRLVLATCGHSAVLRFPSGDSVQFPGLDGQCTVLSDHGVLPGGKSCWEIGAQRTGITGKANKDYTKRTRAPGT